MAVAQGLAFGAIVEAFAFVRMYGLVAANCFVIANHLA